MSKYDTLGKKTTLLKSLVSNHKKMPKKCGFLTKRENTTPKNRIFLEKNDTKSVVNMTKYYTYFMKKRQKKTTPLHQIYHYKFSQWDSHFFTEKNT